MKIMFIGTGAADHDWSRYGEDGVSGSTATLIDDRMRVRFDRRARTLWPTAPAEQEQIARRENAELAHEGETVYLPR